MGNNRILLSITLASVFAATPLAAATIKNTFGNVVTTVGGHPADIALDESRSQLYIANFTALSIDVMSTTSKAINTSIPLGSHPSGVALSPDNKYLVVTEYQNGTSSPQGFNGVTIINLASNAKQTFGTGGPALGVAFVRTGQGAGQNSGQALVATDSGFYLLDPVSGSMQLVISVANAGLQLPVPQATFPPQIIQTQLTASADGLWIWGVADGGTGTQLIFRYNAVAGQFVAQVWQTSPVLLPRVSVAADGSWAMIGWTQFAPAQCNIGGGLGGFMIPSRYPQATAPGNITGHAVNARNGVTDTIYAQVFDPTQPLGPPYYTSSSSNYPTLAIMDTDNLTVRDKLYIPENLVGRAVLDSAGNNMYAISDSGVTVLPVGSLSKTPRLVASQEDLLVQTNFCNRNPLTATFQITDPGNNATDFQIFAAQAGVLVSPSSGKAPATITVTVQPGAIPNPGGTLAVMLNITSGTAVNQPVSVRLLISNPDQDQRGTVLNAPGKLVDLIPDVARNRFYVLRQDKNKLMIFDGSSYQQMAAVRTPTTPKGMSLTTDQKYLLIAGGDSQLIEVYDLDALQPQSVSAPWWNLASRSVSPLPIQLPASQFGVSVAASLGQTFAVTENDQTPPGNLVSLDMNSRCAYTPPSLGIFQNSLPPTSALTASSNMRFILLAEPDGHVKLYDSNIDTWPLSRKDLTGLSGAYAVSPNGDGSNSGPVFPSQYIIGDNVFDASLVPQGTLDTSLGSTVGFSFVSSSAGYRVTGTSAAANGVIQNLSSVQQASNVRAVRTVEAPMLASSTQPFTRTVAPLTNSIIVLTTSGVTVLAPGYDAAVTSPSISAVTSAADGTLPVAPGGLISVWGSQMSPINLATSTIPLPTALAGSCVSVNGVPVPLIYVSGGQINAQLPFNVSGSASMSIHTPGGISNNFNFSIAPTAPSVFLSGSAGPVNGIATILRADNYQLVTPTNPVRPKDTLVIYLTGMGATSPQVDAGLPGPMQAPFATTLSTPSVAINGYGLDVQFAGIAPGEVGVYQINAYVPTGVPPGLTMPLTISQGGITTTLSVRVVN